jgi:hypothetical protein
MLAFKGSLHVTNANEPLKFYTIKCVPRSNFFSSGSKQKSLRANSLVVITGGIISDIALSIAVAIN